jgi:hypothetical protein
MRYVSNAPALANSVALGQPRSWLRRLCFRHRWLEVGRIDDLIYERCARCEKQRHRHLPVDVDAP